MARQCGEWVGSDHLRNLDGVVTLARIDLDTAGDVAGIDEPQFQAYADSAKGGGCPVSRALAGIPEITLTAKLLTAEERIETMIKHSIEINRPAEQVFAYLDQVDRHNEWQGSLVSTTIETDGPMRVGTRVVERRNVPGGGETSHSRSHSTTPRARSRSAGPAA
jgi:hypothetical protein